jgi:hypothetical protein
MKTITKDPRYVAFRILQFTFFVAPVIAGLDKFFYLLTNWSGYIAPFFLQIINYHDRGFMMIVGVMEIIAGLGVIFRPKFFANVIALWLIAIILNLFLKGQYFDIALRDLGLCLSAISLGILSPKHE